MTDFHYSTKNKPTPGPIWPEFNPAGPKSKYLVHIKQSGGPNYWTEMRKVFEHDFNTLPLERFKVWASVLSVPFMSQSRASEYILRGLNAIKANASMLDVLKEPLVGLDEEVDLPSFQVFSDLPITMNRLQHFGHLDIADVVDKIKNMKRIVEIGAGIGDMADIIHKLGFKGEYIIYDFAEVSNIQKWYHKQLGWNNIQYVSDIADLEPNSADLVIATWSLTEMPLDFRTEITSKLKGSKNWIVAYSNQILGLDNSSYMDNFRELIENTETPFDEVEVYPVPWMPWDGGTNYWLARTNT